ncbi:MAG: glycosyltransferase family 39 protein [bacterium]|nr:glycosyltransferase family 39 protein [bacterium]
MSKSTKLILIVILLLSAVLRLSWLSLGDPTTDEVLIAFRAMEMYDFDEGGDQPTPLEWFDEKSTIRHPNSTVTEFGFPWWTYWSFHDHPPLAFLFQYFSMNIFGDTNFGFRLPSALLGIIGVFLMYLIGKELYSNESGIFAALFLAVTLNHVYISRIGMQEAYSIFFIILTFYLFIRGLKNDKYFIWMGVALGLALLAKYTTFIIGVVMDLYILIWRRDLIKNKNIWIGVALMALIFSPVILYNIGLYQAVGHFDFQVSHVFGQETPLWQIQPGKEIGTLGERIERFVPTLFKINSYVFIILFLLSLIFFVFRLFSRPKEVWKKHSLLIIALTLFSLFIVIVIGPSYRFVSMLTPFLVLSVAVFLAHIWRRYGTSYKTSFLVVLGLVVLFEIGYTVNSQVRYVSGKETSPWTHSQALRWEKYNGGYNELGGYLAKELEGRRPLHVIEMAYAFLDDLHEETAKKQIKEGLEPYSAVVIYDKNIDHLAQLWVLDRLNIYHAWPVMDTKQYVDFAVANNIDDLINTGFDNYYFIRPTGAVYQRLPESQTNTGAVFEELLLEAGFVPKEILNPRGEVAFRIYKF